MVEVFDRLDGMFDEWQRRNPAEAQMVVSARPSWLERMCSKRVAPWRSFLAGEVLALVDAGQTTVATLQRDVLVPFELELAARRTAMRWLPGEW